MVKDMTEQEKIEFAQNIYSDKCQKALKYGKKNIISGCVLGAAWIAAICVVVAVLPYVPSIFYPLAIFAAGYSTTISVLRGYKTLSKAVKDAGYGKVSYREYKKLLKSGELEQWAKGNTKGNVVEQQPTTVQPSTQDGGVQLSAEEVAVLKKLMEKQGISNVDDLQTSNQQPTTKTPTDNGRNS